MMTSLAIITIGFNEIVVAVHDSADTSYYHCY